MGRRPPPQAISAPNLVGAPTGLGAPVRGPRENRRARGRPYRHVRLEIALAGSAPARKLRVPALDEIAAALRERSVAEPDGLLALAAGALHALRASGLRDVGHWEIVPGGWLPVPLHPPAGDSASATVHELLDGLSGLPKGTMAGARSFSARLAGEGDRADLVVRRIHRQRVPSISLDLWGRWTKESVDGLRGAFAERLPVARAEIVRYEYA